MKDPEADKRDTWYDAVFEQRGGDDSSSPPFSFRCGDVLAADLLAGGRQTVKTVAAGDGANRETHTWELADGLTVQCEVTRFAEAPAVEWVVYLENSGSAETAIIADIQALDTRISVPREVGACLHHARGSECAYTDFEPLLTPLGPCPAAPQAPWRGASSPVVIGSQGGRSSCGALPFFNLETEGCGVIGAVGWTGDWVARCYREADGSVRLRAGMSRTHLKLLPGERIRSPRILLLFWEGNLWRGHNLLRRLLLRHYTPAVNGAPARPPVSCPTWGGNYFDKHIEHGRWWQQQQLPLDYLWVDAGWFGDDEVKPGATVFNSQWWRFVGDWYANPGYFPDGLQPLGEALSEMGLKFLLWLEPERAYKGTRWVGQYPDWFLGPVGDNFLFDLGIPAARQMLTDHLSDLIEQGHIGCYRQDFNTDPRPFWDAADGPERIGISEIRHICGLYQMWDELRSRHPGLLIDNCASGGRRIDLETIARSVPLWRSDVQCYPGFSVTAMQTQTHGLGLWVPLSAGCCDRQETYAFRSALGPGLNILMYGFENDTGQAFDSDWLRARLAEEAAVQPFFDGDLYPLLSFSCAEDVWAAWQYHRPDLDAGIVLVFRRSESPILSMSLRLSGVSADAAYQVRDADAGDLGGYAGADLLRGNLTVHIATAAEARLIFYERADGR